MNLHENWWKFFPQASRSFLNPPGTSQTAGKPKFLDRKKLQTEKEINDYSHLSVIFFLQWLLEVLEVLESSGRLKGTISTYVRQ